MYIIYWIINEQRNKTYVGFSDDLPRRLQEHKNKKVKSTQDFGKLSCYKLETVDSLAKAIKREKYWKSCAGRKKLKVSFGKI
ncbi:MAG: GIY-YIG nuclease family protein [Candidatus Komeilibacteria bacterium]|nr:GIY-YIG nuclease family protein [Candidatus Komeilibacteria bacterium]